MPVSKLPEPGKKSSGVGPAKADEVFMAWNYSRYVGKVAEAGKAEYPVPMFVNTWIVQPTDKGRAIIRAAGRSLKITTSGARAGRS